MLKIKKLINEMTLVEKASLLSGENFWQTRSIDRLNIPSMALADGPHGLRKQDSEGDHLGLVEGVKSTCFPTSATMSNSWNMPLCKKIGEALGKEAVYNDVNILLGPGLNIKRNPLCGRNFEYFSEDPYLSGKLASSYVNGVQSQGVGACLKHFAANNQEYLRMTNDSIIDDRTLHEIYLTGFEIAVKESKPKAVMSSYNKINGEYAHEHKYLLKDVLVDTWGFDGMIVSDWGGSNDTIKGTKAGSHLEMPSTGKDSIFTLVDGVESGKIDEKTIDKQVEKFLEVLFSTEIKDSNEKVDYEKHHKLAQKAAEESAVLLKNDGILPLSSKSKIAIIGDFAETPRYQGAGSSMVNSYKLDNTLEMIQEFDAEFVGYAQGYKRMGGRDQKLIDKAIELSKKAEFVLLYVGLNEVNEVEGHDRINAMIDQNQQDLIDELSKVSNKLIVVLNAGSLVEMPWVDKCNALLHGYLSGEAGAKALLNIIFGKVNPSGKLTETHIYKYEDCPSVRYYPGTEKTSEYREGIYVGYRYYEKSNIDVLFPFGYGLSYTEFTYSNLIIEENKIKVTIANTGEIAGSEIIQMYIGKEQDKIHRPIKELKGFTKVSLGPNESIEVEIPFDDYTFRYFDSKEKEFKVEKGSYNILIGSSSKDIRLSGTIELEGKEVTEDYKTKLKKYYDGNVADIDTSEFAELYGRDLPNPNWDRNSKLGLNDSISQMVYAKNPLARLGLKILLGLRNRSLEKGKPDLNLLFLSSMPFRAIIKMSDGALSTEMVENIVVIVNGKFCKGTVGFIKAFNKYRKREVN